ESYTVSVSTGTDSGCLYGYRPSDLTSAGDNGMHLAYPVSAGVYSASLGARPTSSWESANYLRDVVFVAGGPDTDGDGIPDDADPDDDNDGMSDEDEAVAGTDPKAVESVLRIAQPEISDLESAVVIHWPSVADRVYGVQAGSNMTDGFTMNLAANIPATPPMNVYTDEVAGAEMRFYRVTAASMAVTNGGGLPPLWNAGPPTGVSPAPSGPLAGVPGEFDTAILATNEVWDNFSGAAGSDPDARLWLEDTINQGGTQVYDPAQSFLDGNGNAVLEAIQSGSTILSGRFTSRTKFNMQYGWCAARIKFPKAGRSWFPAFWLLFVGYNTGNPYGEIDMMEFFGNTSTYNTHIHFGSDPSLSAIKAVPDSHSGGDAGDGFHTYWMQWEPDRIWIGVDDFVMGDWSPDSVPAGYWDHMRQPFYFIANFAAAPSWLPAPEPGDFPARMLIDWIWYKPLPASAESN
ncbi:MAG: glycoside hydrolase family 16 protein, partial [Kiritimatiellae bacterium]|nr:glycoside hydrolase family 16 protein [Kiritimatiellia bacterium]